MQIAFNPQNLLHFINIFPNPDDAAVQIKLFHFCYFTSSNNAITVKGFTNNPHHYSKSILSSNYIKFL